MAHFLVSVANYEYGTRKKEYCIEASEVHTAVSRAMREFKKDKVVTRRISELDIQVTRIKFNGLNNQTQD